MSTGARILADTQNGRFNALLSMKLARIWSASVFFKNTLYVIAGGFDIQVSDPSSLVVQQYDFGSKTWSTAPNLITPRLAPAAAVLGDRIFVAGGSSNNYVTPGMEYWTPGYPNWISAPNMPVPTAYSAYTSYQNRMYIIGGMMNNGQPATVMQSFDNSSGWQPPVSIPRPVIYGSATAYNSKIYVFSGFGNGPASEAEPLLVYDLNTKKWTSVKIEPGRLSSTIVTVGNKLYLAGGMRRRAGESGAEVVGTVLELDPNTYVLKPVPPIMYARFGSAICVCQDNTIVQAGGAIYTGIITMRPDGLPLVKPTSTVGDPGFLPMDTVEALNMQEISFNLYRKL
jgi:hypothetical protein